MIPVITIDGPSGSGKGTISLRLAKVLGWHWLDSGAIYRAIAWAILHYKILLTDKNALREMLTRVQIAIENHRLGAAAKIRCDGHDITQAIREEGCAVMASQASALPMVREALLQYQRDFRRPPGLVADGRDMGTVVFPDAVVKFYFNANPAERAKRRYQQLQGQGINVSLRDIQEDLLERDRRDRDRAISPAEPARDAIVIDTTQMDVDTVFAKVMHDIQQRGLI